MARVLGINAVFHDPAAALVVDGEIVAAAEEERFSRRKHGKPPVPFSTWELPEQAIRLVPGGGRPHARPTSTRSPTPTTRPVPADRRRHHRRQLGGAAHALRAARAAVPRDRARRAGAATFRFVAAPRRARGVGDLRVRLRPVLGAGAGRPRRARRPTWPGGSTAGRFEVLARAGPAALARAALRGADRAPRLPALVRRVQGDGDGVLRGAGVPATSSGELVRTDGAGGFRVAADLDFARFAPRARAGRASSTADHADLAASVQRRLEEVLLELATWLHAADGRPRPGAGRRRRAQLRGELAAVAAKGRSSRVWVQPAAGDAGTALGRRAAGGARARATEPRRCARRRSGRGWDEDELEAALNVAGVEFARPDDIADAVAEVLADDGVVAWFQGRSEFGPRALGHRWLLADPRRPENLERLNDVKGREQFRPVAPMVLAERAQRDLPRRADPVAVHALRARRARASGATGSRPSCTSTAPPASRPSTAPTSRWSPGCSTPSRR